MSTIHVHLTEVTWSYVAIAATEAWQNMSIALHKKPMQFSVFLKMFLDSFFQMVISGSDIIMYSGRQLWAQFFFPKCLSVAQVLAYKTLRLECMVGCPEGIKHFYFTVLICLLFHFHIEYPLIHTFSSISYLLSPRRSCFLKCVYKNCLNPFKVNLIHLDAFGFCAINRKWKLY